MTKMFRYILQTTFDILRVSVFQDCIINVMEKAYAQFVVRLCAYAFSNLINFRTRNDVTFSILPRFLRQVAHVV